MKQIILLVDDEAPVRKLMARALAEMSCEVMAACDGVEALEVIAKVRPDLVVLDVKMPRKDGWAVLRALRSQAGTRSIPIIMLTGCNDTASELNGLDMGADDYITKPFELKDLRARVASVLRRSSSDPRQSSGTAGSET